jgi:hypothetical protein
MNELIAQASRRLRVPEDVARAATVQLLILIRDKIDGQGFSELIEIFPDAAVLVPPPHVPRGGLAGLADRVGHALSGRPGVSLGVRARLEAAGLNLAQGETFATLFLDFIRLRAGADLVARIAGPIPELRSFL